MWIHSNVPFKYFIWNRVTFKKKKLRGDLLSKHLYVFRPADAGIHCRACSLLGDHRSLTQTLHVLEARRLSLALWAQPRCSSASLPFSPRKMEILSLVQTRAYPWPRLSSLWLFTKTASLFWFPAFTPNTDGDLWFTEEAGVCWVSQEDVVPSPASSRCLDAWVWSDMLCNFSPFVFS